MFVAAGLWMLKVVADMGVVSETVTAQEYKEQAERTRKDALRGKPLHGRFFSEDQWDSR